MSYARNNNHAASSSPPDMDGLRRSTVRSNHLGAPAYDATDPATWGLDNLTTFPPASSTRTFRADPFRTSAGHPIPNAASRNNEPSIIVMNTQGPLSHWAATLPGVPLQNHADLIKNIEDECQLRNWLLQLIFFSGYSQKLFEDDDTRRQCATVCIKQYEDKKHHRIPEDIFVDVQNGLMKSIKTCVESILVHDIYDIVKYRVQSVGPKGAKRKEDTDEHAPTTPFYQLRNTHIRSSASDLRYNSSVAHDLMAERASLLLHRHTKEGRVLFFQNEIVEDIAFWLLERHQLFEKLKFTKADNTINSELPVALLFYAAFIDVCAVDSFSSHGFSIIPAFQHLISGSIYKMLEVEIAAAGSNMEFWMRRTVLFNIATKDPNRMEEYRKNATPTHFFERRNIGVDP